jgi:hypothetical protein
MAGCGCGKRAAENRDYSTVQWLVNGVQFPTLAAARDEARKTGAQVQRAFGPSAPAAS